jgi:putative transcriptional regulator
MDLYQQEEPMASPLPSEAAARETIPLPGVGRIGAWFAAAAVLALISSIVLRVSTPPLPLRFALVLLPAPALIGLVIAVRRFSGRLDELQRRMQLEAFATAFGVATIGFIVFAQLAIAQMIGPEDWVFPWLAIFFGYHYGLLSARKRNWSQAELGDRLGVSRQTINSIETGKYDPSLPLAFKIARLFDRPIEQVFFEGGPAGRNGAS